MIYLRFRAWDLPLNPEAWRKAECVYHGRTTVSPSTINRYFMASLSGDKDILWGLSPGYRYFSGGSSEKQKDLLILDFYLNCFFLCFFLLFNKRILLLILLTQPRQFRVLFFFIVEELYLSKTLYLRGKAGQLAVLTLNNSPITHLVALRYGFTWELVISVTLNSIWQTTANVCALC